MLSAAINTARALGCSEEQCIYPVLCSDVCRQRAGAVTYLSWIDALPVMRITAFDFEQLLEYSATNPSGTTPGKMWKCLSGSFNRSFLRAGGKPRWVVKEYYETPELTQKDKIGIRSFRPVVIVRAVTSRAGWALGEPKAL